MATVLDEKQANAASETRDVIGRCLAAAERGRAEVARLGGQMAAAA